MSLRFTPGEFYGLRDARRRIDGFDVASLTATGHEDDVQDHTHESAHFVLVLSGTYLSSAQGAPELAPAPTLIFNPAGTRHRDRFLGGVGRFLTLTLEPGVGDPTQVDDDRAVRLNDPFALRSARRLEVALRGADAAFPLEACALQLLAGLGPGEAASRTPGWLGDAVEMIREEGPRVSVASVAAFVGVHPVHLARVFRDCLGCAPGEYLRGARLERASSLLGRTALALSDVASESGFADQAHLTRSFRAGFGITPGAWRRRSKVARVQYGET